MINQIFMPSLASGACTMSDRGSPIAVPGVAAGGYNNNSHKQHRASTLIKAGRLALTISQWLLQIELIFRLLLKITVEEPHACDLTYLCPPRGGTIQKAKPFIRVLLLLNMPKGVSYQSVAAIRPCRPVRSTTLVHRPRKAPRTRLSGCVGGNWAFGGWTLAVWATSPTVPWVRFRNVTTYVSG